MGLFVKVENKNKYIQLTNRKLSKVFSYSAVISYFILLPILYFIFKDNFSIAAMGALLFLLWFFGMWLAIEGICYGFFFPKKYEKQGKKVERKLGSGIKIYK